MKAWIKGWDAKANRLLTNTSAAWNKGNEALAAVEQLLNLGGAVKVSALKSELAETTKKLREMEAALKSASKYVMELGAYVSTLPAGASGTTKQLSREFQVFNEDNVQTIAAIIRNGIMPHLWGINLSHIYAREVR